MPPAVATGRSFSGVIVMLLVTPELLAAPTPSEFASVITQVMVRVPDVAVGSSLDELKVMDLSAVWYWARVAVPVTVSTPLELL